MFWVNSSNPLLSPVDCPLKRFALCNNALCSTELSFPNYSTISVNPLGTVTFELVPFQAPILPFIGVLSSADKWTTLPIHFEVCGYETLTKII